MMTFISFFLVTHGAPSATLKDALVPSLVGFWSIAIVWYTINYLLSKFGMLPWPYPNGAGQSLPKDIYESNHHQTPMAFRVYLGLNAVIAVTLTLIVVIYTHGRP
jgi:hypothetical protein